jgi:hypothetical protein
MASILLIYAMLSVVLTRPVNGLSLREILGLSTELHSSKIDFAIKNLADKMDKSQINKSELLQTFSDPFQSKSLDENPSISIISLPTNDHASDKEKSMIRTTTCNNHHECEGSQTLARKETMSVQDGSSRHEQIINTITEIKKPFEFPIDIPFP